MKYVFAAGLVLLALVTVFHADKLIPVPRAVGAVMTTGMAKHMPFGIQTAYAESCVSGLEGNQDRIRYAVSGAAVRLREVDHRIAGLREARDRCVSQIKSFVDSGQDVDEATLRQAVAAHEDLQQKLDHAQETRARINDTLNNLEAAEGQVSQNVTTINDRLTIVQLDHEHNNARELAAELTDASYPGKPTAAQCAKVIGRMEHRERVREELHRRYATEPLGDTSRQEQEDPWERARQIADGDC